MSNYPYCLIALLEGKRDPNLGGGFFPERLAPKERQEYLAQEGRMRGQYLGACLDSCRWGSQTTVTWESTIRGMIDFVLQWIKLNQDNLKFHEKNTPDLYKKFELPYINHEKCPRNSEHKGTMKDQAGRIRCANINIKKLKPNFIFKHAPFFDPYSQMDEILYEDLIPQDQEPIEKMIKFEQEERTIIIQEPCWAILSDKNLILSLEAVLKRLNLRPETRIVYCNNYHFSSCKRLDELSPLVRETSEDLGLCPGHNEPNPNYETPFDGWTLAFYVQKWYEQLEDKSQLPVFRKNFQAISLEEALKAV